MNIYVGNLAYSTTEQELSELFGAYGEVRSAHVISDKVTGQSKGFGFVEMSDNQAAENAIRELNGKQVKGRALKVNEAKPRADRPPQQRRPRY
ncbi:MAG: RNA-binding protein [Gammaproteobacteria bacterium]|nr:RNA-binding protein [Gammaproteobacteria bacterium]